MVFSVGVKCPPKKFGSAQKIPSTHRKCPNVVQCVGKGRCNYHRSPVVPRCSRRVSVTLQQSAKTASQLRRASRQAEPPSVKLVSVTIKTTLLKTVSKIGVEVDVIRGAGHSTCEKNAGLQEPARSGECHPNIVKSRRFDARKQAETLLEATDKIVCCRSVRTTGQQAR